jgi:hypothetical protein
MGTSWSPIFRAPQDREVGRDIPTTRTLPPPAASKVYVLTEDGQELGRAIVPLAAWGVRILAANRRKRTEAFRPAWGLLFLRETFDASSARDVHDVYAFTTR